MKFSMKTKPFAHQLRILAMSWSREYFALFMRQGTGKSKVTIDTAVNLKLKKDAIDAVMILSDKGWYTNWIEELEKHWPVSVLPYRTYIWEAGESKKKRDQPLQARALLRGKRMPIALVNIDAIATARGRAFVKAFLKAHRCLMVIDESSSIAMPNRKRTKAACTLGKLAHYRRILNGTPVEQGPLKLYGQVKFLHEQIFGPSVVAFRHEYARWRPMRSARGRRFEVLVKDDHGRPVYQNMDQLRDILRTFSVFVKKEECFDLPPKTFQKYVFDLLPEQRKRYDKLRDDFLLELQEQGGEITLAEVLTRWLRLQQIASGLLPESDGTPAEVWLKPEENPRLLALDHLVDNFGDDDPMIVWARFIPDVDQIISLLSPRGPVCRFDGQVPAKARQQYRKDFAGGKYRFLVGNVHVGGKSATWTHVKGTVFYSNDHSSEWRVQAEDRVHRYGLKDHNALYIDLIARDTIDEKIVAVHRGNMEMAEMISAGTWI